MSITNPVERLVRLPQNRREPYKPMCLLADTILPGKALIVAASRSPLVLLNAFHAPADRYGSLGSRGFARDSPVHAPAASIYRRSLAGPRALAH